MNESDFDALCEGMSADEVKRLRKILVSWSVGDEHSFPVQMALLTRAQWLAAATLPRQLEQACELMELKTAEYRRQVGELLRALDQTLAGKLKELAAITGSQQEATLKAIGEIDTRLSDAETVGSQIQHQLELGAVAWKRAKADFEAASQKLDASREELETQQRKRDWIWAALILLGTLILGIVVGFQLSVK